MDFNGANNTLHTVTRTLLCLAILSVSVVAKYVQTATWTPVCQFSQIFIYNHMPRIMQCAINALKVYAPQHRQQIIHVLYFGRRWYQENEDDFSIKDLISNTLLQITNLQGNKRTCQLTVFLCFLVNVYLCCLKAWLKIKIKIEIRLHFIDIYDDNCTHFDTYHI